MDNYLVLIFFVFICNGFLEGLVEVIINSDDYILVRVIIFLGEFLYMVNIIFFYLYSYYLYCLLILMNMVVFFDIFKEKRL